MITRPKLRVGTRRSPLALAQAESVRRHLVAAHPTLADVQAIEIVPLQTTGDRVQDRSLAEIGGKGLFTKEIDSALLHGEIDIAVHSVKDLYTVMPEGIILSCLLAREDARDAFISPVAVSLGALPRGAVVGTASLRRQAQVRARYPHLDIVILRGNVQTRLRKLSEGEVDATLLAIAGLRRLGMEHHATAILSEEEMLPAVGQGAIGVTCRDGDIRALSLLAPLNDKVTEICVSCERAFLTVLDGSCRAPIAALAVLEADKRQPEVWFRGLIASPDGRTVLRVERRGRAEDAKAMGHDAALDLLDRGGKALWSVMAYGA